MKIIKDKVAKLAFVALLIAVTSAMFYAPKASSDTIIFRYVSNL